MMETTAVFRRVSPKDAPALCKIYEPYVSNTTISFETVPPCAAEFADRIADISKQFPYIVCEVDGKIAGYAYAHRYRERAAYDWDAELSIYLDQNLHGRGIGKALYSALIDILKLMGYQTVYGVVTSPNPKSERMHTDMGFRFAGVQKKSGFKLGAWCGIATYELPIGSYPDNPAPPLKIDAIDAKAVDAILKATPHNSRLLP